MKTLRLEHGDLTLGGEGYATISGAAKLRQDIGLALTEPYGTDRFHPRWGSVLGEYVGQALTPDMSFYAEGEITRVLRNYATVQGQLVEQDILSGARSRFTSDGLVREIGTVIVRPGLDRLEARIAITTLAGTQVAVDVTTRG